MRQHVGCEECDGDGIPVFQIESHGFRQVGTHLFERVAVADFQPGCEPHHAATGHASHDTALRRAHHLRRAVCRVSESWTVWQGEGFFFDEYESRFQILHVHFGIGAREDACFAVGERDLREVVVVGE